jgi:hypothetical protein
MRPQSIANFDANANSPFMWVGIADGLRAAAQALRRSITIPASAAPSFSRQVRSYQLLPVFLMLRAFQLECLLKARLVAAHRPVAKHGRLHDGRVRTHNLVALCARVGIAISEPERDILECLAVFSEMGRYPVTRHVAQARMPKGLQRRDDIWERTDERAFKALEKRVRERR